MPFLSTLLLSALAVTGVLAYPQSSAAKKSLEIFGRQTTDQCSTQCSGDTNTLNAIAQCASTSTGTNAAVCICQNWANLSSGCSTCVLAEDDETAADFQASCAEVESLGSGATGVSTASGSTPTGSTTCVASSCSSAGDQAAANTIANCGPADTNCICAAAEELSPSCLSCVLSADGLTAADLAGVCAGGVGSSISSNLGAATSAGGSASSQPTISLGSGSGTTAGSGGSGNTPAGSSPTTGSSASASPSPTKSAAGKLSFGGNSGVTLAGAFVVLGGMMALL